MPEARSASFRLATALLCCALPIAAQEVPPPAGKAVVALGQKGTPPFVLEAGEHDLRAIINRAAAYLGRNILVIDNIDVPQQKGAGPGAIELQQPMTLDAAGCEEVLTSLLYVRGAALVPIDEAKSLYEVVSMYGPRGREIYARAPTRTIEEVLARPNLRMAVTVAMPLQHINATVATNALRPFFASSGNQAAGSLMVGNVGTSGSILLSGFQDQVAAAIRILHAADRPPSQELMERDQMLQSLMQRVAALEQRLQGAPATQSK